MDKSNNSSAERFRAVRDLLGFTQQELADELLLTRNYIAKIETGLGDPSPRALAALESLRVRLSNNPAPAAGSPNFIAHEDQAPYGTPLEIEAEVRRAFAALIDAAQGDPQRLHWIAVQMKEHLAIPKSWRRRPVDLGVEVVLPSQNQPRALAPTASRRARPA